MYGNKTLWINCVLLFNFIIFVNNSIFSYRSELVMFAYVKINGGIVVQLYVCN
jgi:hypothetical protein